MSIAVDAGAPSSAFREPFAGAHHSLAAWPADDHAADQESFHHVSMHALHAAPAADPLPRVSRSHFISEFFPNLCGVYSSENSDKNSPHHEVAARALSAHTKRIGTETMTEGGRGRGTAFGVNFGGETVNRASFENALCTLVYKLRSAWLGIHSRGSVVGY